VAFCGSNLANIRLRQQVQRIPGPCCTGARTPKLQPWLPQRKLCLYKLRIRMKNS